MACNTVGLPHVRRASSHPEKYRKSHKYLQILCMPGVYVFELPNQPAELSTIGQSAGLKISSAPRLPQASASQMASS